MAKIGQPLTAPESGWKRYDADIIPAHHGVWQTTTSKDGRTFVGGSVLYSGEAGAFISFQFTGTKLRLITEIYTTYGQNVEIEIDGKVDFFSQYNPTPSEFKSSILVYEKLNLSDGIHAVKITKNDGDFMHIDAIDIDDTGRLFHPDEVTDPKELEVGKRIRCHYQATSGQVGTFSGLGQETSDFIPVASTATPNGDFYFIMVEDWNRRKILLADRNIQHSISWDTLNSAGIASGSGLPKGINYNTYSSPTVLLTSTTAFWSLPTSNKSFYVKFRANIRGGYYLMSSGSQSGSTGFHISYQSGNPGIGLRTADRSYGIAGIKINLNKWSDYMLVWTGSRLDWYVDGILDKSDPDGVSVSSSNSQTSLTILRPNNTGNYSGDADITNLEIYEGTVDSPITSVDAINLRFGFEGLPKDISASLILMSGGISSTDKDNEWDKYIVNSTLNETITAGNNNVWSWDGVGSFTSTTHTTSSSNRSVRGKWIFNSTIFDSFNSASGYTSTNFTGITGGFRPLLEIGFPPQYRWFIKINNEYKTYKSSWKTISTTLPTLDTFKSEGMDNLSVLYRKTTSFVLPMDDNTASGEVLGNGKVFKEKIDLRKHFEIVSISTK